MRNLVLAAATAAVTATSGMLLTPAAAAAAWAPDGFRVAVDGLDLVETAQYVHEGRKHCWYREGWHGPGWYWCGYHRRHGHGWGGPEGWQGWEQRREHHERRPYERRY